MGDVNIPEAHRISIRNAFSRQVESLPEQHDFQIHTIRVVTDLHNHARGNSTAEKNDSVRQ